MGHFIENCRICKEVTSQCRCPDPNKEQRWTICDKCKGKTQPEAGGLHGAPPILRFKVTIARQEVVEMDFVVDVEEQKSGRIFTVAAAKVEAMKKAKDTEYPRARTAEYEVISVREIK